MSPAAYLQGTEAGLQAVSHQDGVHWNEAQQGLLDLAHGGTVLFQVLLRDAREPPENKHTSDLQHHGPIERE